MDIPVVADLVWHPLVPEGAGNRQRILALVTHSVGLAMHLFGPGPAHPALVRHFTEVQPWRPPWRPPWFNPDILGFLHPTSQARLATASAAIHPHVVHSEGLWSIPAARRASRRRCPMMVTVNNLEHLVLARRGKREWALAVRLIERLWYAHADRLIAVSAEDVQRLRELLGRSCPPVDIVPNGVEPPVQGVLPAALPHPNVVFVGKTDYPPNAEAVRILEHEWLPAALKRGMKATAVIIGGPAKPGARGPMVYTGYVEDVWPLVAAADVCVAPLRAGSGTRLKILTYCAAGRPVIATRIAVEGLGLEPMTHYLPAEDGEEFAEALARLLHTPELAASLSARGLALASRHSWSTIAQQWSGIVRSAAGH